MREKLKFRYSPDVDILTIVLRDEKPEYGEEVAPGVIMHYDVDDRPVEIEILDASEFLTSAIGEVLKATRKIAEAMSA